ncbi:uncharacterized protein LOC144768245 [Lissotriton helveticus]
MKRLWLAARIRRGESGVVWNPCACSSISAIPATEECSDATTQCVKIKKDGLPPNLLKHEVGTVKADGNVETPVSLQEHQKDRHSNWMSLEDETHNSQEEYTEQKPKKPGGSPEGLKIEVPFSENNENTTVPSLDPEQLNKRQNEPISAANTQDKSTESGQCANTRPKLKKARDKKKSMEYICAKYGKSFCRPTELLKYQRTYIGDNSAMFNELGKYFKRFPATDQKIEIKEKLSPAIEKENILNIPQSLQIHQQEKTVEEEKLPPTSNNDTNVTRSPFLVPHQDTNTEPAESEKSISGLSSIQRRPEKPSGKRYPYTECEKIFTASSTLKRHLDKHIGKRYTCTDCGKSYGRISNLKMHQKVHKYQQTYIGDNSAMFNELGKYFKRFPATDQKIEIKEKLSPAIEKENILNIPQSLQIHQQEKTVEEEKLPPNTNNDTNVTRSPFLVPHQDTNIEPTESEKSVSGLSSIQRRPEKPSGKRYPCSECEKSFTASSTLKRHLDIHIGKQYACTDCGKSYGRIDRLKMHQKVHTENKPHRRTGHRTDVTSNLNLTE